ncbi:MAG: ATP-grasp domain-containing protein [Planctomycetota bacterium]|nr:ATP-grasp domain-containing protein [Planctomycetota bacterium]
MDLNQEYNNVSGPKGDEKHSETWCRLEKWGGSLVFLALDPFMALPFIDLLPRSQALVIAWDESQAVKQLEAFGVEVLVLGQELEGKRSTARLFDHSRARAAINHRARRGSVGILAFKPDARLEKAVASLGFDRDRVKLLAADVSVARRFENKLKFPELVKDFDIPVPSYQILKPSCGPDFVEIAEGFGLPFVAQSGSGFSGAGTHLVHDLQSWSDAVGSRAEKPLKVSRFLNGMSLTLNGCVLGRDYDPVVGAVMEQLTGWDELTPYPLGSCGNVWGAPGCPVETRAAATNAAMNVGRALKEHGFIGHFGVDLVVKDDGGVAVIECNPRFTATLPVDTLNSEMRGEVPLFHLHVLASLGLDFDDLLERKDGPPVTQLIYRHRGNPLRLPARVWSSISPDGDSLSLGPMSFLTADHLCSDAAFFLPAAGGRQIDEGKESARLILAGALTDERRIWAIERLLSLSASYQESSYPPAS